MSYMHIDNLYKAREILLFRECYAMEKIHGTSAHISYKADDVLRFFAGGVAHESFVALFAHNALLEGFRNVGQPAVTIYGEAYGGKCQGMKAVYGPAIRFVAFEVKIGECWLCVPDAESIAKAVGLEFVYYEKTSTDIADLDRLRDRPSVQAARNGMGHNHNSEGIVLRPLIEVTMNNGKRIMAKYKNEAFAERIHTPKVIRPRTEVLDNADAIATEWVTEMRLTHVLDAFPNAGIEQTGEIIKAMIADVEREAEEEIVTSKESRAAIGKRTAQMWKERIRNTPCG